MARAEWNLLYDKHYRKNDVYEMQWDNMQLDKYVVAGAPFGGPIAMVRDERKVLLLGINDEDGHRPKMRIYTSAGKLISSFMWKEKGLVAMSWTDDENLVCVLDSGAVYIYSVHGDRISSFELGSACRRDGVAECVLWGSGLVARTGGKSELYFVSSFKIPQVAQLPSPGLKAPPICMAVIPPDLNADGSPEVLLATAEGSVVVVDKGGAQDQLLDNGPFCKMVPSPTGGVIACFNDAGTLFVMSTDFTKILSTFSTSSKVPPRDVAWCGRKSVVLYWDKILLMVGPYGDFVKYTYEGPLVMFPECDGIRIITDEQCQFLSRVADSTEGIFKIGSTTPAALLYDAALAFERQSVKADENIRSIKAAGNKKGADLEGAIDQCLDAAAHEFDYGAQKTLLKAASFGKLSCEEYSADKFVDMIRILRVLNAIRHSSVGVPLTFEQYSKLEAEVVVDRLINRHEHLLALRICEYLQMPLHKVLIHWACAKIKNAEDESDQEIGGLIVAKLQRCPGVSYAKVASTAFHTGRRGLAAMLLEYEPLATDQVPLLVSMKEEELALEKAIESGDTDLVYLCILHIKQNRPDDFFRIIKDKPLARNLFISYCKKRDLNALQDFYYYMHQPVQAGHTLALQAFKETEWKARNRKLEMALKRYKDGKPINPFPAAMTEEHLKLAKEQASAERARNEALRGVRGKADSAKDSEESFIDKSVSQMLELHILKGDFRAALKLQKNFKVPETRLWHIEVRTLAKCRAWGELAKLTANKKAPPIGFQPFVDVCVEQNNFQEAARYISRLPEAEEQMDWFCQIGYWKEAIDIAVQEKSPDHLQVIRQRALRKPEVVAQIDRVLATL